MKITSFDPLIMTTDTESAIKLFEELGFESSHTKDDMDDRADIIGVRMKDPNGFHVDICTANSDRIERDLTVIRMNVDDFDEAAELLKKNGFRESKVVPSNYTSSSKYAFFVSPSGFIIDLIKHIKKEDK
jgi:adenylate cyclase class IV